MNDLVVYILVWGSIFLCCFGLVWGMLRNSDKTQTPAPTAKKE